MKTAERQLEDALRTLVRKQRRLLKDVFAHPEFLTDPYYRKAGRNLQKRYAALTTPSPPSTRSAGSKP